MTIVNLMKPILLLCSILFVCTPSNGQSDKGKKLAPFGVFTMAGNSAGRNLNINAPVNNRLDESRYGFVSTGFYKFVKIKNDTLRGYIRYLKIDLAYFAFRSGAFDIGNGNLARLGAASSDLSVSIPLSFKVTSEIEGYFSFGGFISYRYENTITPIQSMTSLNFGSKFRPGVVTEFGFKTLSGSVIGTRLMLELNNNKFPLTSAGIFFGLLPTLETKIK